MTLHTRFWDTINDLIRQCADYRKAFKGKKKRCTIEGAFGFSIVDKVHTQLVRLKSWIRKSETKIKNTLRDGYKQLMLLCVELAYYHKNYWHDKVRHIALTMANLLPDECFQLSLFDDAEYTNKSITKKPVFACFQKWLCRFNNRKFERDLQRYLDNPNFSYYRKQKSPFLQPSIPNLFRLAV